MKLEGHIYCDREECPTHQHIGPDRFHSGVLYDLPPGWIRVDPGDVEEDLVFCDWDCVMKYAAQFPPAEIIDASGGD